MIGLPAGIRRFCALLEQNGKTAYLTGGCVRDMLLGIPPSDYDIATDASPQEILSIFRDSGCDAAEIGGVCGTIRVSDRAGCGEGQTRARGGKPAAADRSTREVDGSAPEDIRDRQSAREVGSSENRAMRDRQSAREIRSSKNRSMRDSQPARDLRITEAEITPFRIEGDYADFRRPSDVRFAGSIANDLARRDFTINAMALSTAGELVDPFGGKADLGSRALRCVGNPYDRFSEDPLRILRALRFLARLSFHPEEHTKRAMFDLSPMLRHLSGERVFSELKLLLSCDAPCSVLREYEQVLRVVLPGFCVYERLDSIPAGSLTRLFCLLRHNTNEAFLGNVSSLKPSGKEKAFLCRLYALSRENVKPCEFSRFGYAARRALSRYGEDVIEGYLSVLRVEFGVDRKAFSEYLLCGVWKISQLALSGGDLLAAGMRGAEIGKALALLLDAVMGGRVKNDRDALNRYLREAKQF